MGRERIGFVTAILIVLVSNFVAGALIDLFLAPGEIVLLSSTRGDSRPWLAGALSVAAGILVGGACVSVGVRLMGHEISYGAAAFAMGVGELLSAALAIAAFSTPARVLVLPLGIVFGLLLPAHLIDEATAREPRTAPPRRQYHGMPSDRQYPY
jgi:hypothetical protein